MAVSMTTQNTVLGQVLPREGAGRLVANLATVLLGTLLLTLSAKISIPTWPVPVTLQTFAVAALAAAFGWRVGVATVALYIAQGMAGLPVFAGGGGAAYILGPTGGFILAWLPMAYIIGRAADSGLSGKPLPLLGWMIVADIVSFGIGLTWLMLWLGQGDFAGAFAQAVQPFVVWDILKMAFAAITVAGLWTATKRKPAA